ncbi:hypothetical protein C8J57DRAFT_1515152 [Mycena rebaudengoi]|nr:hypothetical protein C8J57DRAFT_1515152 [Mycena rebaudengoi]
MLFRKDRVRAIGVFKARAELTREKVQELALKMVEAVKSFKAERVSGTLASELGLQETEFSAMVLVEAESHDKIHEALTDPGYRKLLAGALEHMTTREDFHFFPAEFMTIIEK